MAESKQQTGRRRARILKRVGVALLAAVSVGFIYEEIGRRQDRKRLPQIGRSVDIGGRTLNIYCSGDGGPVVIFDSGNGKPGYAWAHIQPEIATSTTSPPSAWRSSTPYSELRPTPLSTNLPRNQSGR